MTYYVSYPFNLNFKWAQIDHEKHVRNCPPLEDIECSVRASQELELVKIPISITIVGDIAPQKDGCP